MRTKAIVTIIALALAAPALAGTEREWEARLAMGGLFAADANYRATYGRVSVMPQLELGRMIGSKAGVWIGLGMTAREGRGGRTGIETNSAQQYLALGAFRLLELGRKLQLRLAAAPLLALYRERAGGLKASGAALGLDVNGALILPLSPLIGVEGRAGYTAASAASEFGDRFKLGGFHAGAGLLARL